jgi:hypothetical protein
LFDEKNLKTTKENLNSNINKLRNTDNNKKDAFNNFIRNINS